MYRIDPRRGIANAVVTQGSTVVDRLF